MCVADFHRFASDTAGGRKRRSRWGDEKVNIGGIATAITSTGVSHAELDKYANLVRLEEITQRLARGNIVPPDDERRSPSPPPTYDAQGRRTNTREQRYRKKLEDEKTQRIERQLQLDPHYQPPMEYAAYRRNVRPMELVYLPTSEYPDINFFGLIIGPRGNTMKKMQEESGAIIKIRGKGSVKEGKGRPGQDMNEREPMHCIVLADRMDQVHHCIKLINKVIETAVSVPEGENDHKRSQLRELAALNGTLRDDENQICQNCGKRGHRKYECPEERNWTAHIICHRCGQQGHLARDCHQSRQMGGNAPPRPGGAFDAEYDNLMAELHGGAAPAAPSSRTPMGMGAHGSQPPRASVAATGVPAPPGSKFRKIPPWRQPDVWNQPGQTRPAGGSGGSGRAGWGGGGHGQEQQGLAPAQWATAYPQQQAAGAGVDGQPDYSKEWAEYYAAQAAAGADPNAAVAATTAAAPAAEGGQDYTKEWEEYYRQQGYAV